MYVGHLAVGLAAKKVAPQANAGWFIAAVSFADLLWPLFLLTGIEHVRVVPGATAFTPLVFDWYPWSHSLLMDFVWGGVLAAIAKWRGVKAPAWLLVALVVSHWVLDFITHAPDMPVWPGSARFGLGLWNSIPLTLAIESVMWIAGIAIYLGVRPLRGWGSHAAFWSFVLVNTALWISGPFGTPPPPQVLAWFALVGWVVVPWAAFADRRLTT